MTPKPRLITEKSKSDFVNAGLPSPPPWLRHADTPATTQSEMTRASAFPPMVSPESVKSESSATTVTPSTWNNSLEVVKSPSPSKPKKEDQRDSFRAKRSYAKPRSSVHPDNFRLRHNEFPGLPVRSEPPDFFQSREEPSEDDSISFPTGSGSKAPTSDQNLPTRPQDVPAHPEDPVPPSSHMDEEPTEDNPLGFSRNKTGISGEGSSSGKPYGPRNSFDHTVLKRSFPYWYAEILYTAKAREQATKDSEAPEGEHPGPTTEEEEREEFLKAARDWWRQ